MDISELDGVVCRLYQAGLAPATQKAYQAGKKRYLDFCRRSGLQPLPVAEGGLCRFVAFLQVEGLRHSTVKSYLSAVRHLQISQALGDPRMDTMPRLELVVRGLKREQAGIPPKPRLPITPVILRQVHAVWKDSHEWDDIMLWAVMCLCFFGFLRSGEVVVPGDHDFDPAQHLTFADVTVDCLSNPSFLSVYIKQSKTDPFRTGVKVIVGRTKEELCPVAAMLAYMVRRGQGEGPLFHFKDGRPLTRQRLVTKMREILKRVGIDSQKYSGHSF